MVQAISSDARDHGETGAARWQVVDHALRGLAARRSSLDAEEARWLREAEALQIWRPLGMVSALDYMERVLGYAPRTAQDRLRVARALGALPRLDAALARGELAFTAVRELTRVATPATEEAWRAAATGLTLRQVEELVADHHAGDNPDDPKDPEARTHVVRLELSAATFARWRQTRQVLADERERQVSDDELIEALCAAALEPTGSAETDGRAKYQVAITRCDRCQRGWQEGAGAIVPVASAAVERALCDAQHIGSLDAAMPERAYQDIAPAVGRLVRRRDGGRCRVPGCRSARGLELHHIVHREHGGGHHAGNLILLCSSCHAAHHDGALRIAGTADRLEVTRPGASRWDRAVRRAAHVGAGTEREHAGDAHVGAEGGGGPTKNSHANDGEIGARAGGAHVGGGVHAGAKEACTRAGGDAQRVSSTDAHVGGDAQRVSSADAHVGVGSERESSADAHVGVGSERESSADADVGVGSQRESSADAHVGAADRAQAVQALRGLGWKHAIASEAVARAARQLGGEPPLERLIFEAIRACPLAS